MSQGANKKELLVEQRQALWDYLDGLLREIPEEFEDAEPAASAEAAPVEPSPIEAPPVEAPPVEAPPQALVDEPTPAIEEPAVEEPEPQIVEPAAMEPPAEPALEEEAYPAWAEPDFQALMFQVGGLRLAVPLVKLHSVVPWPEQVAGMPNKPAWCHGLVRYREVNVKIIDTAELVLPPDKRAGEELAPRHILIVGDGRWGLACSSVGEVVRLTPAEVKWRQRGGKRPWLAGTVLGHLCALVDTEAFAAMLSEGRAAEVR